MVGTKEDLWLMAKSYGLSVEDLDWRKNKERGSNGHKSLIQTSMEMNGITFQDMQRVARGIYDEPDLPPISNTDSDYNYDDGKIINKSSLDHDDDEDLPPISKTESDIHDGKIINKSSLDDDDEDLGQYDCSSESDIDIAALVKKLDDTSTDYSTDYSSDDSSDDDDYDDVPVFPLATTGASAGGNKDKQRITDKRLRRQRQSQSDDKLEHDLYEQLEPQVSRGVRNLHEKLSATSHSLPAVSAPAKPKVALNLESFLQELHLEKYLTKFQKQKIGMSLVPIMKDRDLFAIGIKEKDDRKKILEALKAMPRDVSTSRRAF